MIKCLWGQCFLGVSGIFVALHCALKDHFAEVSKIVEAGAASKPIALLILFLQMHCNDITNKSIKPFYSRTPVLS